MLNQFTAGAGYLLIYQMYAQYDAEDDMGGNSGRFARVEFPARKRTFG
jgi:hypothetical protein